MFNEKNQFKAFESKVWLSSPTMHGDEIEYVKEAYETNWMSTVGENINEAERITCEKVGCKTLSDRLQREKNKAVRPVQIWP